MQPRMAAKATVSLPLMLAIPEPSIPFDLGGRTVTKWAQEEEVPSSLGVLGSVVENNYGLNQATIFYRRVYWNVLVLLLGSTKT